MKKWYFLALVAVIVLVGLIFARPFVIRRVVQAVAAGGVGADIEVQEVHVNVWRSNVLLTGIQFRNPPDFPGDTAVEIERLNMSYCPLSLFTRTVRLSHMELDVRRAVLVTNEAGQMNLLHIARRGGMGEPAAPPPVPPAPEAATRNREREKFAVPEERVRRAGKKMHIERLTFRLAEVEMRDYSGEASEPHVRNYRLNLERTFSEVDSLDVVAQAVGADLAMALGPQLLLNLMEDTGVRTEDLMETISTHDGDLDELGRKLDEQTKDLQRKLRRQMRVLRDRGE